MGLREPDSMELRLATWNGPLRIERNLEFLTVAFERQTRRGVQILAAIIRCGAESLRMEFLYLLEKFFGQTPYKKMLSTGIWKVRIETHWATLFLVRTRQLRRCCKVRRTSGFGYPIQRTNWRW